MKRSALALVQKDFQIESGSKALFTSRLFLSFILIFLSSLAIVLNPKIKPELGGLIFWLVLISIAYQTLNRSLASEMDSGCWDALCLCPISLRVIYLGKFIYNSLILIIVELITFPLYLIFFNLEVSSVVILVPIFLVTLGFISIGLLFALLSLKTSGRELAIQITSLPLVLPALFIGLRATYNLLSGGTLLDNWTLLLLLIIYDLLAIAIPLIAFNSDLAE